MVEGLAYEFAAAFLDVQEIDAGGLDAHDGLARAGDWGGQVFETHHFWGAVGMNANRAHGESSPDRGT